MEYRIYVNISYIFFMKLFFSFVSVTMILTSRYTHILYVIYIITQDLSWTRAELFTAISEVEPLLETHKRIIDDLDDYIAKEEKRLAVLKK